MKTYIDLFLAFLRTGLLGYGGGPSSIPLFYKEVVERYRWMSDDEFSDSLALGNALPGPIATKMAGYIGYRVAGLTGCLVALIANVLPTVFLLILFMTALNKYKDLDRVQGIAKAVVPVVGVMMGQLTWDFVKKAKGYFGWFMTVILVIFCLIILEGFHIHPALLIAGLLLAAIFKRDKPEEKQTEKVNNW